jgi:hypothetical protein
MDKLMLILVVGLASMLIGVVCLAIIGFRSVASPTLVLATATMASATLFFILQLWFSLSPTETESVFGVDVTIDHSQPGIWHAKKHGESNVRKSIEVQAGQWLAKHKSELFSRQVGGDVLTTNTDKLSRDLTLFSVLVYMAYTEPTWNLNVVSLNTKLGNIRQIPRGSSGAECTLVDEAAFRRILTGAGNAFAEVDPSPFFSLAFLPLCLPPETRISLTASDLIIENPYSRISFQVEEYPSLITNSNVEPGSNARKMPLRGDLGVFESRLTAVKVHLKQFALRSQHADSAKYRVWSERLVKGVLRWFEEEERMASPADAAPPV